MRALLTLDCDSPMEAWHEDGIDALGWKAAGSYAIFLVATVFSLNWVFWLVVLCLRILDAMILIMIFMLIVVSFPYETLGAVYRKVI